MKLKDVLDEIKAANGLTTNRALAHHIGIDERRIPEYYKGREPMDDDYALIALACNRRIDELQALVKLDRPKDAKSREVWEKYYKRIGGIAASIALLFFLAVNLIVTPTPANASERGISIPKTLYYVKSTCQWLIRKLVAFAQHRTAIATQRFGFVG